MSHNHKIKEGIISALCYSDIFDFPLTRDEICKYYVGEESCSDFAIYQNIEELISEGFIEKSDNLYFLTGRKSIAYLRRERERISLEKIKLAARISNYLSKIPTIKMIGVSGSLSVDNSKKEDDIDLFFITSKHALWITRLLVNLMLIVKGYKRARQEKFGVDKICPNMFVTEDTLKIENSRRSLFVAREIMQLKPLFEKDKSYVRFMVENDWILQYLPNTKLNENFKVKRYKSSFVISFINDLSFIAQYIYMMRRITSEEIKLNIARFHPRDASFYVDKMYKLRLKKHLSGFYEEAMKVRNLSEDTPGY